MSVNVPNYCPPHGDQGEEAEILPKASTSSEKQISCCRDSGKVGQQNPRGPAHTHTPEPTSTLEPKGLLVYGVSLSLEPQLSSESSSDLSVLVPLGDALKKGSPVHPTGSRLCKTELNVSWGRLDFPWQQ